MHDPVLIVDIDNLQPRVNQLVVNHLYASYWIPSMLFTLQIAYQDLSAAAGITETDRTALQVSQLLF